MKENKKYKILMLSDHALSTSGVGCQSRFLIEGLLKKGTWSVRQFGAALKHENYDLIKVNEDFIIKPIDGFGNRDMLIHTLATEKPDILLIFTDPRFFTWLFQIEDEIRGVCPIAYWHVWDNLPYPNFNEPYYESVDLINCHSYLTYEMLKDKFPEKVNFVPHSIPENIFYPLEEKEVKKIKADFLGNHNKDSFVLLWVNRNARRKRPADVIWSWSKFINNLSKDQICQKKPILLMHTDPNDVEGPNLIEVAKHFEVLDSIVWSNKRVEFDKMNAIHNISNACLNISFAEGFGLPTLESMNCAKPIIAVKTGGLTRQVIDHRDNSENGIALDVDFRSCVGSQTVPFIIEDYTSCDSIADGIMKLYLKNEDELKELGIKSRNYALSEFNYQKMIDDWDKTLIKTIEDFKIKKNKRWRITEVNQ
jgi:glycosyltransferase involved in cell wall biosynthesis